MTTNDITTNPDGTRTFTRTIQDYAPELRSLLASLKKHGATILSCANERGGELTDYSPENEAGFIEELLGCDEGWLYVNVPSSPRARCIYLVYGNEPGVIVCDYHVSPEIDAATDGHYKKWNGRKQPTRSVSTVLKSRNV